MSFNDAISQPAQEELVSIRNGMNLLQWTVGDIVLKEYNQHKDCYAFNYVCAAAAYFVGKSGSTVQRWARAAAFYSKELRTKYDGLLTFEHFATAMQFKDWEERLERAAYGGRNEEPQSVDQMNAEAFVAPSAPENFPVSPSAVVSYEINEPTVQVLGMSNNTIQTILGLIGRLADALHLDDERRAKVYRAMELLSEAMGLAVESR